MRPELTELINIRDVDGDELLLARRDNGHRAYTLRIGREMVFLAPEDLDRLGAAIASETAL